MNNPKRRKVAPISSTSFRQINNSRGKPTEPPYYTYRFIEKETTALDTIFAHLFEKLTD